MNPPTLPTPQEPQGAPVPIPAAVLALRGYSTSRVFAALAAQGAATRYIPITIVDLAQGAGVHRNTARAALRRLASAGFAEEKPGRPGYWRIFMDRQGEQIGAQIRRQEEEEGE